MGQFGQQCFDGHFKSIKSKVEMKYSTFCIVMHVIFLFLVMAKAHIAFGKVS
jgi:hypothetical protein